MANPISELINRVQSMDGTELDADASAYSVALASVLEAAGDPQQLDRYRRALANLSAWLLDADGEESPRVPPVQTLLQAVEALQQVAPGDPDLDVQALAAMVRGK